MPRLRGTVSRSALALICALSSSAAFAQLDKAEKALRELEFGPALKALDVAKKQPGNDRVTTLRILELQAITLATTGQEEKALKAFQALLSLVPEYALAGNHPPRVTTVFYEARSWLDQNKPLLVEALPAVKGPEGVSALKVEVTNDPLKLVKELRFVVDSDGTKRELDVPVAGKAVSTPVSGRKVEWSVLALGEKKAVLLSLPARLEQVAPPPVPAVSDAAKDAAARDAAARAAAGRDAAGRDAAGRETAGRDTAGRDAASGDAPGRDATRDAEARTEPARDGDAAIGAWSEPPRPMPAGRIAGLAIAGGGVAVAGLGIVFGVMSNGTRAQITGAQTDGSGRVTSLTQREALELDARQRTEAAVANVCFVAGGVLAAGGVTLFLLTKDDAQVAVAPAPGGVLITGRF